MAPITARQRVLLYLKHRGPATTARIARSLDMSTAAVRHHLAILAADGRIDGDDTSEIHGRGRPQKLYRLADRTRGSNLPALASVLLQKFARSLLDSAELRSELSLLADGLQRRMGPLDEKLPATKRLEQLIERLDAAHYEAGWEAGAEGPRVFFRVCPYAEIIDEYPELCAVDGYLLGGAMHAVAEQTAKISRRTAQPDRCIFVLRRVRRGD